MVIIDRLSQGLAQPVNVCSKLAVRCQSFGEHWHPLNHDKGQRRLHTQKMALQIVSLARFELQLHNTFWREMLVACASVSHGAKAPLTIT